MWCKNGFLKANGRLCPFEGGVFHIKNRDGSFDNKFLSFLSVAKNNLNMKYYNLATIMEWLSIAKEYLHLFHSGGAVAKLL